MYIYTHINASFKLQLIPYYRKKKSHKTVARHATLSDYFCIYLSESIPHNVRKLTVQRHSRGESRILLAAVWELAHRTQIIGQT